jgi:hypothetical protein
MDLKISAEADSSNRPQSKVKREYGNKAYQEGKDLDALYLYTQVNACPALITHKYGTHCVRQTLNGIIINQEITDYPIILFLSTTL